MLEWFLQHSTRLNFSAARDYEIRKFLPNVHDYIVTVQLGNQIIWGRGIDWNETNSLKAACAEVVERATLQYQKSLGHKWTSNGIASHSNLESAREYATAELIERDTFLTHYLTNSPFALDEAFSSFGNIRKSLEVHGVELFLLSLPSPTGWYTAVAFCFGANATKPFGVFVGAATKRHRDDAQIKAIKEVLAFVSGFLRDFDIREVQEAQDGPLYHYRFSSERLDTSKMEHFLSGSRFNSNHLDLRAIKTKTLPLHPAFEGCPVTVVRATSPDAQQLFFGETKPEHINFKRLSQFLGKEVRWEDVNKTTHVFA